MADVTDLLRSNQTRYFDPMGMHFACFQEDTEELLDAIRSNESVIGFWFDPFLPTSDDDDDDALRQDYLNWCSQLLDACSQFRGLRRAYMNTSHFPLSLKQSCQFVQQARQLEHFSLGLLSSVDKYCLSDGTNWLNGPLVPLLHQLRDHSHLSCFDLHLPDQKTDAARGLLKELYTLSNLQELRVSFGRACPGDRNQIPCWMSSLLQNMPRLHRLSLRNAVHEHSTSFVNALQDNSTLQELRLVDNLLDELGWNALAQSLRTNCHLHILRICHGNVVPDKFLRYLVQALNGNHNTALQEIHLAGSESDEGCDEQTNALLLNLMSSNTSLKYIEIEGHEPNEVIELYLKLNRAGRSKWRSDFEACWDCLLQQDLDCIYTMLQDNPMLCSRC
jgi:hypothetical protein